MVEDIAVVSRGVLEQDSRRDIVTVRESRKFRFRREEECEHFFQGSLKISPLTRLPPSYHGELFAPWHQSVVAGTKQSHHVYDARVRSKSKQLTLVVMYLVHPFEKFLLFHKDGSCYNLPLIPGLQGIPQDSKCISLDGKLYVLGGFQGSTRGLASACVFLFDLAGERHWKQCASMALPRAKFGCGVFDGKIYVFGGFASPGSEWKVCIRTRLSEVYNPKKDSWSPIMYMTSIQSNHTVTAVGDELFVYNGHIGFPSFMTWEQNQVIDPDDYSLYDPGNRAYSADVYHPLKDEWRSVGHFVRNPWENFVLVMVEGETHMVNSVGLHIYDRHANSWTLSKSFSFPEIGPRDTHGVAPFAAVAVDDVLLVDVIWRSWPRDGIYHLPQQIQPCRMISRGLGGENKEMVFWKAPCPSSPFMCLIEL